MLEAVVASSEMRHDTLCGKAPTGNSVKYIEVDGSQLDSS